MSRNPCAQRDGAGHVSFRVQARRSLDRSDATAIEERREAVPNPDTDVSGSKSTREAVPNLDNYVSGSNSDFHSKQRRASSTASARRCHAGW